MTGTIDQKLQALGLNLPKPGTAAGTYVPYVQTGNLVFISGQVPLGPKGLEFQGKLGHDMSLEQGQAAARLCALNLLAQLKVACDGDLDRVKRCVKLGGFVNAIPEFDQHPAIINGASDLLVEIFGEAGRHARFAVGAPCLPFNVTVEIDAVFEIA